MAFIPLAVAIARPGVPLGQSSVIAGALVGLVAGYIAEWIWFELSIRLRCATSPGCSLLTTPAQEVLWALGLLGFQLL